MRWEDLMQQAEIGVVGGSGLYEMDGISDLTEVRLDTPFGEPSDAFRVGSLEGRRVAFLARHGQGHTIMPSDINFRANIFAFKLLGVERIVSASAVGSLREELKPLDIVIPDQFIDVTRGRPSTFFGRGLVAHVAFGDPVCPELVDLMTESCKESGCTTHRGGSYVCMEGPQFSTRAESELYRRANGSVIGMTNLQEAKLAREAEICYVSMALVTDYDCWHDEETVSVEAVIERLGKNAVAARNSIRALLRSLPKERGCECGSALKNAIITQPSAIDPEARTKLAPLVAKYLETT
jgi:5'-methylthioadenosine phosphorylase